MISASIEPDKNLVTNRSSPSYRTRWHHTSYLCVAFVLSLIVKRTNDVRKLRHSVDVRASEPHPYTHVAESVSSPTMFNLTCQAKPRFFYLAQGPKRDDDHIGLEESCDRRVIWLTYKQPSLRSGDIFLPNSTWTEGRNVLFENAIRSLHTDKDRSSIEYFVFLDGDSAPRVKHTVDDQMKSNHNVNEHDEYSNNWLAFENFLLHVSPAVGSMKARVQEQFRKFVTIDGRHSILANRDGCISAFHRETVTLLLPYIGELVLPPFG